MRVLGAGSAPPDAEPVEAGEDERARGMAVGFDDLPHHLEPRHVRRRRVTGEEPARRDGDVRGVERRGTHPHQGIPLGAHGRGNLRNARRLTDRLDAERLHSRPSARRRRG